MSAYKKLSEIQKKLKAPKSQHNSFGNYSYRSCEDILENVKPLLGDAYLVISDEVVEIGGRVYVKATAKLCIEGECVEVSAFAREAESKKGMDEAQITGSASSYARKYALNGLFCIDDTKDADTQDNRDHVVKKTAPTPSNGNSGVRLMKSKYDGVCALTGDKIEVGDEVYYNPKTKKVSLKDNYDAWKKGQTSEGPITDLEEIQV